MWEPRRAHAHLLHCQTREQASPGHELSVNEEMLPLTHEIECLLLKMSATIRRTTYASAAGINPAVPNSTFAENVAPASCKRGVGRTQRGQQAHGPPPDYVPV